MYGAELTEGYRALQRADLTKARAAFDRILAAQPRHINGTLGMAEVELKAGNTGAAEQLLKRALTAAPRNPDVLVAYGRFNSTTGRFDAAMALLNKATVQSPDHYAAWRDLGDLRLNAYKKPDAAIDAYRRAAAIRADTAAPYVGIAMANLALDRKDRARTELAKAVVLAPKDPALLHMIGRIEASEKRFPQAIAAMDRALSIDPRMAAALSDRADIHAEVEQNKQAAADYEALLKLAPETPPTLLKLGMVYQRLDRLDDARRSYLAALALNKDLPVAYNNLASMSLARKESAVQANTWARNAVALAPKVPHFQDTLGMSFRALGDHVRAIEALRTAVSLNSNEVVFLFHLGLAYEDAGRKAEAADAYSLAVKVAPNTPEALQARTRLAALKR